MPSVKVNGLATYYEVHGEGKPLTLLHGGVWGLAGLEPLIAGLAAQRRVIAVELQGHGRTAEVDRPLSWEGMAADVAGLLDHLDIPRSDWMGYSLGGGVALHAAILHPTKVDRLVLLSTPFARRGWYPEVLEGMAQMESAVEGMKQSPLAQLYPQVDWAVLFRKLRDLLAVDYDLSGEVAALTLPAMLTFADADSISPGHIAEFYNLLGGGLRDAGLDGSQRSASRLAVLPGHTHYDVATSPVLPALVNDFLAATPRG